MVNLAIIFYAFNLVDLAISRRVVSSSSPPCVARWVRTAGARAATGTAASWGAPQTARSSSASPLSPAP